MVPAFISNLKSQISNLFFVPRHCSSMISSRLIGMVPAFISNLKSQISNLLFAPCHSSLFTCHGFSVPSGDRRPPKSEVWCAGINRQEAEDEKSVRGRSSEPLGPEFCAVGREA
jgi:hypothetical protein